MIALLAAVVVQSKAPVFPLTVPSIMRGYALVGHAPRGLRWSADGSLLRFSWAKADGKGDPAFRNYIVNRDGTGLKPDPGATAPEDLLPANADRFDERSTYAQGGDLYVFDRTEKKTKRLTATQDGESDPRYVEGGKAIVYTRAGNLYRLDLAEGTTSQLTDIRPAPAPPAAGVPASESQAALAREQAKLFKDFAGGGDRPRRESPKNGNGAAPSPLPIQIPAGYEMANLSVSPSGNGVAITLYESAKGDRIAQVPNYVTRSGYTEEIETYEKVGDRQSRSKIVILELDTGGKHEMAPLRPGTVGRVRWSKDGRFAAVWADAEDNKDSWLLTYDYANGGDVTVLWTEHDDAWVGGPLKGLLGWIGDDVYFGSERSGYSHLMRGFPSARPPRSADGEAQAPLVAAKPLTSGPFEISDVTVDEERKRFLFLSSEDGPAKRRLNAMSFEGGAVTKLADLTADDDAAYALHPDGKTLAIVRSKPNHPGELYLEGKAVTQTPTDEWLAGPWIVPPIVEVPARDGKRVPGRLYKPKDWKKGGPAVVFVHGAGYLQNIFDGWSYYYREYMFHHLLMSRGYAVLDLDYRASAGYGRDWRTAIYRHMGGTDLDDQVDGARWLAREQGVNPQRIGIYGGSYGGFITLMAMFTAPGTFAAGAALRPVTDWAHYNHGYTSNILNFPQDDPVAYRQSSPIYHAEGLRGALLICHGMVDTNVHFQDSVRLSERLIELGKENWELAPYPVENHAFRRPESWTDEYRRILNLFEKTIGPGYRK
ncbi:S9 family peptidase [bacterium]|nr:MAG: S9 family peptidase [bacterium]